MNDVTQILEAVRHGDDGATDRLFSLVYDELRRIAANKMAREAPGHTLQPTALVHEAWLRLGGGDQQARFENRAHFFGAAAEAMRRILVDRARRKQAQRRGSGAEHVPVEDVEIAAPGKEDEILAVDEALENLAAQEPKKHELVKLRYFGGLTIAEAAQVMGISEPTAKRWWAYARAWLYQAIKGTSEAEEQPGQGGPGNSET